MPSRLDGDQKNALGAFLKERDDWTTGEARDLILEEFGVEYTLKQVRVIKGSKMKFGKPCPMMLTGPWTLRSS